MKRAIPVVVLSIAGLIPVWRYEPSTATSSTSQVAAPAPSTSASGGSSSRVVTGTTVDTEKGPVEVQVTFDGEKITAARMLKQPNHRDRKSVV